MIVCVTDPQPVYHTMSFPAEDCAAAVENMLLAIAALGYATVWIDGALRAEGGPSKSASYWACRREEPCASCCRSASPPNPASNEKSCPSRNVRSSITTARRGSRSMSVPCDTDKVVILARGLGTRMRQTDDRIVLDSRQEAMASTGTKAAIPIGRPFLDHVLTSLADAGYRRVCLVVGPEHHAIRDYYGRQLRPERLSITFAIQPEPKGTADAVAAAEPFVADDYFVVINSDNYYPLEALRALRNLPGPATALFDDESMLREGNTARDRLAKFALGIADADGFLERIVEKPDPAALEHWPRPHWLSMNCWRFSPAIFQACRSIPPSPRNELEIPSAVQYSMWVLGEKYRVVKVLRRRARSDQPRRHRRGEGCLGDKAGKPMTQGSCSTGSTSAEIWRTDCRRPVWSVLRAASKASLFRPPCRNIDGIRARPAPSCGAVGTAARVICAGRIELLGKHTDYARRTSR